MPYVCNIWNALFFSYDTKKCKKVEKKIGLKYDTFFSHDMKKCIKVEKTKIGLKCDTFFTLLDKVVYELIFSDKHR